jgi:hypothetical protein
LLMPICLDGEGMWSRKFLFLLEAYVYWLVEEAKDRSSRDRGELKMATSRGSCPATWGWTWWGWRVRPRQAATTQLGCSARDRATWWMTVYWFIRIQVVAIWMDLVRWHDQKIWTKFSQAEIILRSPLNALWPLDLRKIVNM